MSWYGQYGGWAPYVPVAQKIANGHAAAKTQAKKEGREPAPVMIKGRIIGKTFWGGNWRENLEQYRDIANRLPRGATYVRNGSVADLIIEPGRVRAIVAGSEAYTIEIKIQTLKPPIWKAILRDCAQEIDSLLDLLQGRFSDGVMQRLTQAEGGLFPHANEITMSCTCPDYADVCKHIAATFYGIAARLDTQPELLFKLRSVDHLELISHATNVGNLNRALDDKSESALSGSDLSQIFGIELESSSDQPISDSIPSTAKPTRKKKRVAPASSAAKAAAKPMHAINTDQPPSKPTARSIVVRSRKSTLKAIERPTAKKATKKKSAKETVNPTTTRRSGKKVTLVKSVIRTRQK